MIDNSPIRTDEAIIVSRIAAGDHAAWGIVYDAYAQHLFRRILMPKLSDPIAAEDALAETFRTGIEKFSQYKDTGSSFFAWLCRIAHNKAIDMHRSRANANRKLADLTQLLGPLMTRVASADEVMILGVESSETKRSVSAGLQLLNPRYRRAIELRFFEEKSRSECAQIMQVRTETFDVLLLRALQSLKKKWHQGAT